MQLEKEKHQSLTTFDGNHGWSKNCWYSDQVINVIK